MHAKFVPFIEGEHCADDQDAPGALVVMRPRPDLAPGIAGDESWNSALKDVFFALARSTHSLPRTLRRWVMPRRGVPFRPWRRPLRMRKLSTVSV